MRLLLFGIQAVSAIPDWQLARGQPADLHAVQRCDRGGSDDEVVVCGSRDPDHYRLKPLPAGFEKAGGVPLAQTGIGGGTVGVVTQQVMIGNVPSNRVLVSLKLPF